MHSTIVNTFETILYMYLYNLHENATIWLRLFTCLQWKNVILSRETKNDDFKLKIICYMNFVFFVNESSENETIFFFVSVNQLGMG